MVGEYGSNIYIYLTHTGPVVLLWQFPMDAIHECNN